MRALLLILSLGLVFASLQTEAATRRKHKVVRKKAVVGDLQTDVKFDDSVLHGRYQAPDDALAKVENEKLLRDLVGVRKNFKDRLKQASEQE